MDMWIRKIGVGCVCLATILAVFFGAGNEKSYAIEEVSYEDEMKEALRAYENMNTQSQQQMLASVNGASLVSVREDDLQTAMMQVQLDQIRLLDSYLKNQLDIVRDGKQNLQDLNKLLQATQVTEEAIRNDNDLQNVMALLQKLGAEMRSAALESRQQELNKQIAELQTAAEQMRNAANSRLAAAITQQSISIVGGVTSVVSSKSRFSPKINRWICSDYNLYPICGMK
ncbi:hypothetical protein [Lederbergia panacisoli]|uniref:hypothetical protein n=1 Tax=Lederbergia panacisoli TaxID=1255251 RepID=UPI00214AD0A0|nr:hypothetical protein [Lederbergia panacisoli]MCR2823604.1 hypothetical protein [Lederbergia panacisoli]